MAKILLADDDSSLRMAYGRLLQKAGHEVVFAEDAHEALAQLGPGRFDVVLSDIVMPGMTGIGLLRAVREHDLDVPVVLMTGTPSIETSIRAVEYGAHRYLLKPVDGKLLVETIDRAAKMHALARLKREALHLAGTGRLIGDIASLEVCFERALSSLWMAFQPIVSAATGKVYAYEALLRTDEPTLLRPPDFVDAAERLGRVHDLGRRVRAAVAQTLPPGEALLFVNLHPSDLGDDELHAPLSPLAAIAGRVVLELTERSSLDSMHDVKGRIASLRELGYRIAIDDLGAGYAGLSWMTHLAADVVKIDMFLTRDVDSDPVRQRVVRSMIELSRSLGMQVIVEGVETEAERAMLVTLGADLLQGYYFAKPGRGFPELLVSVT
jgi:EAL domain-containing protein (putative c-di-GMP-specific phosphodiesterase class I)